MALFGRRPDGRRVKHMDPLVRLTPYLMPMRCDAQVFLDHEVDYEPLMRYIAKKNREGIKITFMEILIASYVRGVSQVPEVNKFVMNKQMFIRNELTVAFTLLLDTPDGSFEETAVKIKFDPSDTLYDVSARVKKAVTQNRNPETPNAVLKLATFLMKVPLLPNIVVGLVKLLDRYGLCPGWFLDIVPFHTGMFVTNMASIGMSKVYHHIYNFGNTGLFFSLGSPKRGYTVDANGNPVRQCVLPIGATADERVCGGAVYAQFFSVVNKCLKFPELLEHPPEEVRFCDGITYHVPKPENVPLPKTDEAATAT